MNVFKVPLPIPLRCDSRNVLTKRRIDCARPMKCPSEVEQHDDVQLST